MCCYLEKAASCQALRMGVLFFIQMSCYKTISLAPFCLIILCANLFILDSVMKTLIGAMCFFFLFYACNSTVIVFSLCASSMFLPSTLPGFRCVLFDVILVSDSWPWYMQVSHLLRSCNMTQTLLLALLIVSVPLWTSCFPLRLIYRLVLASCLLSL